MRVLIFGATGMVGQGVLRECLEDPGIESITIIGRTASGMVLPRVKEIVRADLFDYSGFETVFSAVDACFFCLGVTSSGMSEAEYTRLTYTLTLAAAQALSRIRPGTAFIYVSGSGTDSSEKGRSMWARVKGRTENDLLKLPLNAWMFRPGFIQPMDGIQSKTPAYRRFYKAIGPLLPLLHKALPNQVLTTREIGQAMIALARDGYSKRILEARDIRAVLRERP